MGAKQSVSCETEMRKKENGAPDFSGTPLLDPEEF